MSRILHADENNTKGSSSDFFSLLPKKLIRNEGNNNEKFSCTFWIDSSLLIWNCIFFMRGHLITYQRNKYHFLKELIWVWPGYDFNHLKIRKPPRLIKIISESN